MSMLNRTLLSVLSTVAQILPGSLPVSGLLGRGTSGAPRLNWEFPQTGSYVGSYFGASNMKPPVLLDPMLDPVFGVLT